MIVDICLYFQVYFANKAKEKAPSLIYLQITFDINSLHWKVMTKWMVPNAIPSILGETLTNVQAQEGGAAIIEKTHKQRQ